MILGCEIKEPILTDAESTPILYIDYEESENQIFTSIALDYIEDFNDTSLNAQFTWLEDLDYEIDDLNIEEVGKK